MSLTDFLFPISQLLLLAVIWTMGKRIDILGQMVSLQHDLLMDYIKADLSAREAELQSYRALLESLKPSTKKKR